MCDGQERDLKIKVITKIDEEPISAGFYNEHSIFIVVYDIDLFFLVFLFVKFKSKS
jgi:hypothetical protein